VSAAEARINLRSALQTLSNLTGLPTIGNLIAPLEIPNFEVSIEEALAQALKNRSYSVSNDRALVDAAKEIDRAKKSNGLNVVLQGSFGLSQTGSQLGDAYKDLLDQEELNLSLQIPIADWGKAKANKALAASNYELVKTQNEQVRIQAEREIIVSAEQLGLLKEKVALAKRSLEIANIRSEITQQRYAIGTETIVELNLALESAENARLQFINSIQAFWIGYYTLRRLTLSDFE
jgi:outer membrane protein TolC